MPATTSYARSIIESSIELPDGSRVHYARSGPLGGPPVVFVHNSIESWRSFRPVVEQLPDHVHAIGVSLPGCAGSDPIVAAPETAPIHMARAVTAVLERLDVADAVIVGHASVADVCDWVALIAPGLVGAWVPIDARWADTGGSNGAWRVAHDVLSIGDQRSLTHR
jgi:pimeloyl-ACP methyl ester carboxylesterase